MNHTDAKALFAIKCREQSNFNKNPDRPVFDMYATQDAIDSYRRYNCCNREVLSVVPADHNWPEGVEVKVTGKSSGRCYAEVHYEVTSPKEMTEDDWDILIAQGAFMVGQETGHILSHEAQKDGTHKYRCRSICDSSD